MKGLFPEGGKQQSIVTVKKTLIEGRKNPSMMPAETAGRVSILLQIVFCITMLVVVIM
jgi:hypothetical protein